MATIYRFTKKELKGIKARDFQEGDVIDIVINEDDILYSIYISYGQYKSPLQTTVADKNGKLLNCTAGTRNGWPYYIADFIHKLPTE